MTFEILELFLKAFFEVCIFFFWNFIASSLENETMKVLCTKVRKPISTSKASLKNAKRKKILLSSKCFIFMKAVSMQNTLFC